MLSWPTVARRVPTAAVTIGAALVLCSGVVTALVLPASSDSISVLRHPVKITVTPLDGAASRAHDGQVLNPGDLVTVGAGGAGEVVTGERKLLLGGAGTGTQVRIDGPASTEIRRGSVVAIDPGKLWSLQADQVAVSGITGAVRIDYGFEIRAADYAGTAELTVPTGATARLAGLDQVEASGSVLPAAPLPLKLADDALDAAAAPALVSLDRALTALAGQIDADPNLLADYPSATASPSETVLPAAIGAAGTGGTPASRARTALATRQHQGSWGVVALSVGADISGVRSELSRLLDSPPAQAAAVTATVTTPTPVGRPPATPGTITGSTASPQISASPSPGATRTVAPSPAGVRTIGPTPAVATSTPGIVPSTRPTVVATTPGPSPSPSTLVNVLLNAVGGLLPSPNPIPIRLGASASPSPSAGAVGQAPSGLVTTVTGQLGGSGH